MASEYTPFCPRYCHRSVLGIRSANKYYIQACVLGKDGDAPMVRLIATMSLVNVASPRLIVARRQVNMPAAWLKLSTPSVALLLVPPVSGGQSR